MASFHTMFMNLGIGLAQTFMSRHVMTLGIKLDSMSEEAIYKALIFAFVSNSENEIGSIVYSACKHGVQSRKYENLLAKHPKFIDNIVHNYIGQHDDYMVEQIDFSGIFDIILLDAWPLKQFCDIIGIDTGIIDAFEPLLSPIIMMTHLNTHDNFVEYLGIVLVPFMKVSVNVIKNICCGEAIVPLEVLPNAIADMAGMLCKNVDKYNARFGLS